jgi:hypothetical protein
VKISPKVSPDEKGLFSWDLALAPKEKRTLRVEYVVQYPSDYTRRPARKNASKLNSFGPVQQQSESMNSLQLQIQSLESKLK